MERAATSLVPQLECPFPIGGFNGSKAEECSITDGSSVGSSLGSRKYHAAQSPSRDVWIDEDGWFPVEQRPRRLFAIVRAVRRWLTLINPLSRISL